MFFSLFLRNIISSSTVADTKIGQPFSEHNFIGVSHCFNLFAFSLQRNGKTKSLIGTVFTHVQVDPHFGAKFFFFLGKNILEKRIFYLRIFFQVPYGYMKNL